MKTLWWIWATFLASTVLSIETLPFDPPQNAQTNKRAFEILRILKRQDDCPGGHSACSNMGKSDICCRDGTNCSRDAADNIACCPTGAKCTGSLTGTSTGTNFMFPQTASATPTSGSPQPTITGSTMTGAAYPFVYVPTSFSNAASCTSYYSLCESEYSMCTANFAGQYGVTVAGPNGAGVTVNGPSATPAAQSVCSSLKMEACHGLSLGHCNSYDNWQSDENRASFKRTSIEDLVFGLAVGIYGVFI